MVNRTISWTNAAVKQFEDAMTYISSDSITGSEKVSADIFKQLGKAVDNPEFFPPDKYKQNNDGSFRAFEKHRYRVAYRYSDKAIWIMRVKHTAMEPGEY